MKPTREQAIAWAREAGIETVLPAPLGQVESIEHFANLVAAAERERIKWDTIHSCHPECDKPVCVAIRNAVAEEREACAKLCDDWTRTPETTGMELTLCAAAIRERGAP